MTLWLAALLGLVQGLTEFLPISSTAHLRVIPALLGKADAGAGYTAVLQLGSVAAVLVYFGKDLVTVARAFVKSPRTPEGRLPWLLAIATVPIVVLGLLLKPYVEGDLRDLWVVSSAMVGIGVVMWLIDNHATKAGAARVISEIMLNDAMLIGLAQSAALIPGVSRSGATICMALMLRFTRSDAARFSFLLSIPAVGGAGILETRHAYHELGSAALPAMAVGTAVAFVTSLAAIAWLMRWLGSHRLVGFAVYRIVCGLALIGALSAGYLRGV